MEIQEVKRLEDLKMYQWLIENNKYEQIYMLCKIYDIIEPILDMISMYYPFFTKHDMRHSLRTAQHMELLAFGIGDKTEFEKRISEFSAFEIMFMILVALLHDAGMCITAQDWIKRVIEEDISDFKVRESIKEEIRKRHSERVEKIIEYPIGNETIKQYLEISGYNFADELIKVCKAHGEDFEYVKKLDIEQVFGIHKCNPQYTAVLLRIADYLDIDNQRVPLSWYYMMDIKGFSASEWKMNFMIQNYNKLRKYSDTEMIVYFQGKSKDSGIHRKYLSYIDSIYKELVNADKLLNSPQIGDDIPKKGKKYALNVRPRIEDWVKTNGFVFSDMRLELDYNAIIGLLMGQNLYGNPQYGLREVIQNSIDACKLMCEIKNREPHNLMFYEPRIYIKYSQKQNYVKVIDFGIGMTMDIIRKYFLNVGVSYYQSYDFKEEKYTYKPIGHFGIGFLASFILSQKVKIKTKWYNSNELITLSLDMESEYVEINTSLTEEPNFRGTEITFNYTQFFKVFTDENILQRFIMNEFHTDVPIYLYNLDDDTPRMHRINMDFETFIQQKNIQSYEKIEINTIVNPIEGCSNQIEGVIYLEKENSYKNMKILSFEHERYYYFDPMTKEFRKVENYTELRDGYYNMLLYPVISSEKYKQMKNGLKSPLNLSNVIMKEAEKFGSFIYLMVNSSDFISEQGDDYGISSINNKYGHFKIQGDIPYISEMFLFGINYHNKMYKLKDKFFWIYNKDDYRKNERNLKLFFRDVYVSEVKNIVLMKSESYINCKANYIKLNTSRDNILSGRNELTHELNLILLNHARKNYTYDFVAGDILDSMINYHKIKLATYFNLNK